MREFLRMMWNGNTVRVAEIKAELAQLQAEMLAEGVDPDCVNDVFRRIREHFKL